MFFSCWQVSFRNPHFLYSAWHFTRKNQKKMAINVEDAPSGGRFGVMSVCKAWNIWDNWMIWPLVYNSAGLLPDVFPAYFFCYAHQAPQLGWWKISLVERLSDVAPGTWQVPECRAHNEALWVCSEQWLGHGETGKMLKKKAQPSNERPEMVKGELQPLAPEFIDFGLLSEWCFWPLEFPLLSLLFLWKV